MNSRGVRGPLASFTNLAFGSGGNLGRNVFAGPPFAIPVAC